MAENPTGSNATSEKDEFHPSSKFISLVQYDPKSYTMDVTFKSGSVHRYLYVFPAAYQTFKQSPSHDSYYARAIKGRLMAVPIVKKTHGRERSTPLHKSQNRKDFLNGGLRGTIARAGL